MLGIKPPLGKELFWYIFKKNSEFKKFRNMKCWLESAPSESDNLYLKKKLQEVVELPTKQN